MYQWNIESMDYTVSQDGRTNVVYAIHWCVSKEEGDHATSSYGAVELDPPTETFVEWADITEELAVSWAKAAMGDERIAAVEAGIDAFFEEKNNPTQGTGVSW